MPLRADLLTPIPGQNPSGVDLRYDPTYDKIKEARREDADLPQGAWQTERKTADYGLVVKLTGDVLATRTKDLQLAAWLTEALLRREGFAGLRDGLALIRAMLDQYWETLYPEMEDGDGEMRAAPLAWMGSRLDTAVRMAAINPAGHSAIRYAQSQAVPTEDEANADTAKAKLREDAIAERRLLPEEFDRALESTPKSWYKELVANLDACLKELEALDTLAGDRFGDAAPSFRLLNDALLEVRVIANQLLARKLAADPDPPSPEPDAGDGTDAAPGAHGAPGAHEAHVASWGAEAQAEGAPSEVVASGGPLPAEPVDRGDATRRVVAAARFLRRTEPHNPAAYLLLRGLRWGELRAHGPEIDPRQLEAPPTPIRARLKGLLLDRRWPELLETAEGVMGTPHGRGWLDLQRYVLTACRELGPAYEFVATAIRAELRALIAALPQLPETTLMDDTPTANAETQAWLRGEILGRHAGDGGVNGGRSNGADPAADPGSYGGSRSGVDRATAELRAGRPERAIELLLHELAGERSVRGQFIRKTQVARIMVEAGMETIAMPILNELLERIDAHKLEEWEAGELVAAPMVLLCRCLDKLDGDQSLRQSLYLRVCRLDPLQAIGFTTP
jgi:type VI secretion system protein ImpA